MRSDFIRLTLLETYGGVYMDASVILTTPLDWVVDAGLDRFQAFFNPDNMTEGCDVPVIENSFLAAPPGHPFVTSWLSHLKRLKTCTSDEIKRVVGDTSLQAELLLEYHFAYHAVTQILQKKRLARFGPFLLRTAFATGLCLLSGTNPSTAFGRRTNWFHTVRS